MINVLSIMHYPVFGGPYNRNMRLAPILATKGVRTTVLVPDESTDGAQRLRQAGVDVVQIPLNRVRATRNLSTHIRFFKHLPSEVRAIREIIHRRQIDVVQVNGLANPHGAFAAHGAGKPVVWLILDTYTPRPLRYALAPCVRRYADVVLCTGQRVADEHPQMMWKPGRLLHFYPPVDTSLFQPDPVIRLNARRELGLDDAPFVVGTVGNINLQKGYDHFLRAAALVKASVPGARFVILGASHDTHTDYMTRLLDLAASLGLKVGVDLLMLDPAARVHELAQAFDVFWMTSRPQSEGIPTAMEEAMALGLPVVSFDVGSIGELVEHGRSGFLVEEQDPGAIARFTFEHLLDSDTRTRLGRHGRAFVERHAALDVCAEIHLAAYHLARQSHLGRGI